jgi:hypothetical protein
MRLGSPASKRTQGIQEFLTAAIRPGKDKMRLDLPLLEGVAAKQANGRRSHWKIQATAGRSAKIVMSILANITEIAIVATLG